MFQQIRIKEESNDSSFVVGDVAGFFPMREANIKKEIKIETKSKICINCGDSLFNCLPQCIKLENTPFVSPKLESNGSENIHPNLKRSLSLESCRCPSSVSSAEDFKQEETISPVQASLFSRDPSKRTHWHSRPKRSRYIPHRQYNNQPNDLSRNWYQPFFSQFVDQATSKAINSDRNYYNYFFYRNYARDNYRRIPEREHFKRPTFSKVEEKPDPSQSDLFLLKMTSSKDISQPAPRQQSSNTNNSESKSMQDDNFNSIISCQDKAPECLVNNSHDSSNMDKINTCSPAFENNQENESIEVVCERFVVTADVIAQDDSSNLSKPEIGDTLTKNTTEEPPKKPSNLCENDMNQIASESYDRELDQVRVENTEGSLNVEGSHGQINEDCIDAEKALNSAYFPTSNSDELQEECMDSNNLDNVQGKFFDNDISEISLKNTDDDTKCSSDTISSGPLEDEVELTQVLKNQKTTPMRPKEPKDSDDEFEKETVFSFVSEELNITFESDLEGDVELALASSESDVECHRGKNDGDHCRSPEFSLEDIDIMVIEEVEKTGKNDISVVTEVCKDGDVSVLNHRTERKVCKKCFLKWRRKKKQKLDVVFLGRKGKTMPPLIELK